MNRIVVAIIVVAVTLAIGYSIGSRLGTAIESRAAQLDSLTKELK